MRLAGEVVVTGRTLHILMREPGGGLPLFFSLITPTPPASVLCGVIAGPAFVANSATPSATSILLVRVPDNTALEASNRYLWPERLAIANDLQALGLPDAAPFDSLAAAFLQPAIAQVDARQQLAFADILDPLYLPSRPHFAEAEPEPPRLAAERG
jgi:hypothetical protein